MSIISKNVRSVSDINGLTVSCEQDQRLRAAEREEATHWGEHVLDFTTTPLLNSTLFLYILILGPETWYLKGGIRGQVILDDGEFL
jgi:hypothetical protein